MYVNQVKYAASGALIEHTFSEGDVWRALDIVWTSGVVSWRALQLALSRKLDTRRYASCDLLREDSRAIVFRVHLVH